MQYDFKSLFEGNILCEMEDCILFHTTELMVESYNDFTHLSLTEYLQHIPCNQNRSKQSIMFRSWTFNPHKEHLSFPWIISPTSPTKGHVFIPSDNHLFIRDTFPHQSSEGIAPIPPPWAFHFIQAKQIAM